ncbi:hypothetical protein PUN28_014229 [Cardiocondyla obscurior]|uniref:Uncharacterized protein n=1 Tax=Cardiocondyla obscurior TaxID=286306 RepID=A0AAW2EZ39_9HYME
MQARHGFSCEDIALVKILKFSDLLQSSESSDRFHFIERQFITKKKMHKKELRSYKQIICHLEENNRHMLEEVSNLKKVSELYKSCTLAFSMLKVITLYLIIFINELRMYCKHFSFL